MHRIIRNRNLTPEEAALDAKVRELINRELLELIAQHRQRQQQQCQGTNTEASVEQNNRMGVQTGEEIPRG